MKIRVVVIVVVVFIGLIFACAEDLPSKRSNQESQKKDIVPPVFNADSAYQFVQDQVDFGPRVPGTDEHLACADYLKDKLELFGADVIVQSSTVTAFDGSQLPMRNIIGQFQKEKEKRILLFAHWDTRPFADKDSLESNWNKPIDGANDGGSGVGVLLEVARLIGETPTEYGIDIIFFDVEDYGTPEFFVGDKGYDTWCLGSQYWAQNPHVPNYRAKFGILLDMVGAKDAKFSKEGTSVALAHNVIRKIFKAGKATGNGSYFDNQVTPQTTDDHLYVNQFAKIPSAAIVQFNKGVKTMGMWSYGFFHHTHQDNMDVIDRETLEAVGETVMYVIYNE